MKVHKQSALYHEHLRLGANLTEIGGWLVPEFYKSTGEELGALTHSVGVSDASFLGKIDIKGREIDKFFEAVFPESSFPKKPREVSIFTGNLGTSYYWDLLKPLGACRLTDDHVFMFTSTNPKSDSVLDVPQNGFQGRAYLTDVTSVFASLNVAGPKVDLLLRKLTQLDFSSAPSPSCAEGGLAGVHSIVVRRDLEYNGRQVKSFDLFLGRNYGEYVWNSIIEAGREFNIVPFGFEAYRMMNPSWNLLSQQKLEGGVM